MQKSSRVVKAGMECVDGTVLILRCDSCGTTFPIFEFAGESDSLTEGVLSATSKESGEIVVVINSRQEWEVARNGSARDVSIFLNKLTQRDDLEHSRLLRAEDTVREKGLSFQEYMRLGGG